MCSQTNKLLKITAFCQETVKTHIHKSRNKTKGTILANELRYVDDQELHQGFACGGVTEVWRIQTMKDGMRRPTAPLVLTFNSSTLPTNVKAGSLRYEVRPFILNPLRCFRCQAMDRTTVAVRLAVLAVDSLNIRVAVPLLRNV